MNRPANSPWRVADTEPIQDAGPIIVHPTQIGGMRHLSAAQFVNDQRDAMALVASQDGRVTVLSWSRSDDIGSRPSRRGSLDVSLMRLKHTTLAIALTVSLASVGYSQVPKTQQDGDTPDFRVQVWGHIVADFSTRVWAYVDLRRELEEGLPALRVTDDPAEIRRAVRALAQRIRVARAEAKQGDIFTPTISVEFRKALLTEMNANTWAAIMDDNPGEFSTRINGTYPERKPISTMPLNILAVLPKLPDDVEYRFLGRHLILLDTRATVILDRIPYAIQCTDRPD